MRIWNWLFLALFAAQGPAAVATGTHRASHAAHGSATTAGVHRDCIGCPEMVALPAGSFDMGMTAAQEIAFGMPRPQAGKADPVHRVTFAKGFMMAKYPVTVAQFRQFVDETHYQTSDTCTNQRFYDGHFIYEPARGYSWRSPGFPQDDRHPVVCVSSEDADAYAAWLSKKSGHHYTVPNEAQYEYAARAGTTTAYFWGDAKDARACEYANEPDLDQAAELKAPSGPDYRFQCHDGYAWTSPVGSYKPNPWGLYDMLGNIWEWTSDCYNNNYQGAPTDGSTWTTGDCDGRASRGGSYGNAVFSTYAAVRAPRHASYIGHSWGFRVVRND